MVQEEKTKSDFFAVTVRPWGLIAAAGVVAGAATILGFFGQFGWFFDLFSHFRVQYFIGLGVIALLLLIPRQYKTAIVFGLLSIVNLSLIIPLYFGELQESEFKGTSIRSMLINVNTKYGKVERVSKIIRQYDPDILVLEEVNSKWLSELYPVLSGYHHSLSEPREDNFGIALFSKFQFARCNVRYIGHADVPSILAEIDTSHGRCAVLAMHAIPPHGREYSGWRNNQLAGIPRYAAQSELPLLLLGDLNVTPWNYHFKRLIRDSGLNDSASGLGFHPTWPAYNPLMWIPIDHCLHSPEISIQKRQVGPSVGSDHYPLIIDFSIFAASLNR